MLALGLLIIGYFLKPTLGVFNSVKGLLGGSGSASLYPTGTVGSVRSLPNTSQEYQGYGQSYTPIRRFFRQMITEHQM
jgi:hypothetical protein